MDAGDLYQLQGEHRAWLSHNFPNQSADEAFLGVVEEVGELAHAILKARQGIRGTVEELEAKEKDAIGDLVVFLDGYCISRGFVLGDIVTDTWHAVQQRDWQANPGGEGY